MPNDRDRFDAAPTGDDSPSWMASLLAEEDSFDRQMLWRLGTWAACAVGALIVAVLAAQSSTVLRRERTAYAEMTRQAQQIQWIAKDSENETRRLAAAVETLNGDRDRLYSRVTILEQGFEPVTGSISKQPGSAPSSAPSPESPPPVTTAPATIADSGPAPEKKNDIKPDQKADTKGDSKPDAGAIPLTPAKPELLKPQTNADTPADSKPAAQQSDLKQNTDDKKGAPVVTSSIAGLSEARGAATSQAVQRTDFGVDIGTANSVEGLRALWRGTVATQGQILRGLQPIIVVKERTDGFGMQLRLVAGPIANAAEAAKLCARLIAGKRGCETTVYDAQRLAMENNTVAPATVANAPRQPRRSRTKPEESPPAQRGFTSIFGR